MMKLRYFAPNTFECYMKAVATFAKHFGKNPEQLGDEHVRAYLLHLVEEKKLAWGTYNQTLAARVQPPLRLASTLGRQAVLRTG